MSRGNLLSSAEVFKATTPAGDYAPQLRAIAGVVASGVYAIADQAGRTLYVGESHTGRLYDTITRHFRKWKIDPSSDRQGRRRGGTTYNRSQVRIAFVVTEADAAQALQFAEISRLRPRDNQVEGKSRDTIDLDIPV